ncbi:MAG: AraC family transcriptional regulator [Arcicella sp.]|jgi:AraC-like DNA-binding protein|nr:AraC family transcriptional regulator [Arcicella sp.]
MKTQLEEIKPDSNSSFHLMVNPRLNDFFFWHFHPEFELVYINGANGTRHVGEHISRFEGSDLVLIGSNIPHLNFDYGVKTDYEKIVLHIQPHFLKEVFSNTPELLAIQQLFEKSQHGIAFYGDSKKMVGERMKKLHLLPPFEQFLEILQLLQQLAHTPTMTLLHEKPVENQHNKKEQERLKRVYEFIDDNFQRKIDIEEVAELSRLSKPAFCRYFKKMTKLTFTEFLGYYRVNHAKKLLRLDKNVTETCFECGFDSLSYFNRTFKKVTGENPLGFKKRYT